MDENLCRDELLRISQQDVCAKADALFVCQTIGRYFGEFQRNQIFKQAELAVSPRFKELLEFFNQNDGATFATQYFLFAYTLADNFRDCQVRIEEEIARPYNDWVNRRWSQSASLVKNIEVGDEIVFICRHATTQGMYAPGKSTYTFLRALLEDGASATLVALGQIDETFKKLAEQYPNFTLAKLTQPRMADRFLLLCSLLAQVRPKAILTEIEFDIVSIFAILGPKMPVILLSAGYYNLPWYDKIGLTDTIADDPVGNRHNDFFVVPTYVANELLNPNIEQSVIAEARKILGIEEGQVVLGSFARMEKLSTPFVNVLTRVLDASKRSKVLLAGPNDSSSVISGLGSHFTNQRALVLGQSDVHILGHCVDIAIDTFPLHSGFSMLELMAKGVPVVAKNDKGIDGYGKQRLPELLCKSEDEMVDLICDLVDCEATRRSFGYETKTLMDCQNNDAVFIDELNKAIAA